MFPDTSYRYQENPVRIYLQGLKVPGGAGFCCRFTTVVKLLFGEQPASYQQSTEVESGHLDSAPVWEIRAG